MIDLKWFPGVYFFIFYVYSVIILFIQVVVMFCILWHVCDGYMEHDNAQSFHAILFKNALKIHSALYE